MRLNSTRDNWRFQVKSTTLSRNQPSGFLNSVSTNDRFVGIDAGKDEIGPESHTVRTSASR